MFCYQYNISPRCGKWRSIRRVRRESLEVVSTSFVYVYRCYCYRPAHNCQTQRFSKCRMLDIKDTLDIEHATSTFGRTLLNTDPILGLVLGGVLPKIGQGTKQNILVDKFKSSLF
ncbi:hypothetical protein EVAR_97088_1 [Eumeta japonica]|uniref:Uncharacterized protein n=1 Tax=Eumeta variegata TaxID=151549 RepID=A0A4C1X8V3_EUMVA|nr:hypothetical protein EVAR_97088_1 [Eumeta japonica]